MHDDWVVFAAAAGYTGMMVAWGCTVWGSGLYYPPYVGYGGYYPYYYPHFPTYGYSAWYNPWTGRLRTQRRRLWSVRRRRRRRPLQPAHRNLRAWRGGLRTVRRARRRAGLQPAHRHLRGDAPGIERLRKLGIDRRCSAATTGPRPIATPTDRPAPPHARSGPTRARRSRGAGRAAAPSRVGDGGNVYAGKDGNVYRRRTATGRSTTTAAGRIPTGSRRRRTDRRRPTGPTATTTAHGDRSTTDQLNRDAAARREGTQRTSDYGNYRSGSPGAAVARGAIGRWRRRARGRRRPAALTQVEIRTAE